MRCKKHTTDLSSIVGVCASCLRERLFVVIEAQSQADLRENHAREEYRRKSDANLPESLCDRSNSPCRKSDSRRSNSLPDQRFHSTQKVCPNGATIPASLYKKKNGKFRMLSNLFGSKTNKFDLDQKTSESKFIDSTWFPNMFPNTPKKSRMFNMSDPNARRVSQRPPCRGMSPVESEDEFEGSSGCTAESSPRWKETPQRAPVPPILPPPGQFRCKRLNQARNNISGLAFCLSPLVRPSPNRHWNQKTLPPEIAVSGENRAPMNPHIAVASEFCANRSRKIANFGRHNRNF